MAVTKTQVQIGGPFGILNDTRTTANSNVRLNELPGKYQPHENKASGSTLAGVGVTLIQGYPGQVHHQRLDAQWQKDPYWGKRKP